jgi:hypothetical protein
VVVVPVVPPPELPAVVVPLPVVVPVVVPLDVLPLEPLVVPACATHWCVSASQVNPSAQSAGALQSVRQEPPSGAQLRWFAQTDGVPVEQFPRPSQKSPVTVSPVQAG